MTDFQALADELQAQAFTLQRDYPVSLQHESHSLLCAATALREAADLQRRFDAEWASNNEQMAECDKFEAELAEAKGLLRKILAWDHLGMAGDGEFWEREIRAVLGKGSADISASIHAPQEAR